MDYLDPHKKHRKKISLMIMYALLGVAIAIATVVVVYLVNGYSIDRQTGEVIQNGLLYLDTHPESADVFLNGEKQRGRTDARLVVPEGDYEIRLARDGYRQWQRNLVLEGGSLRRLTYARLVPEVLDSELAVNLPSNPTMASQSSDKRWLVMAFTDNPLLLRVVDLNRAGLQLASISLPLDLLSTKEAGTWEVLDWADDNRTFLASYTTVNTKEFVLVDREDAAKSVRISSVFPTTAYTEVSLRSRKNDLIHMFNKSTQTLYEANVSSGVVNVLLQDVLQYKAYSDDAVLYVTAKDSEAGMVTAYLKKGKDLYKLRSLKESPEYLLDISKLGNAIVLGIGSPVENRVVIYNDPISALKQNDFSTIPVPTTVLRVNNPKDLVISADSSVIMARGGQSFASHEFDADRSYSFKMDVLLEAEQKLRWLDGQHVLVSSAGVQYVLDFDGSNIYDLVQTDVLLGSYMDKNSDLLYSFLPPAETNTPPRLMRTFMRTSADR